VLKKLYSTAKLFVYPSLYEGFGLPILDILIKKVQKFKASIDSNDGE
jgi:glycosyltransferase involved in cell wall biosynthesis